MSNANNPDRAHQKILSARDIILVALLPILVFISWALPPRLWFIFTRGLAPIVFGLSLFSGRGRDNFRGIRYMLQGQCPLSSLLRIATERIAHKYWDMLLTLRMYLPRGYCPKMKIEGEQNLHAALNEGHGAILWVSDFVYGSLVTKIALHQAGYEVSHLSRPSHGFSDTRAARRMLNPIRTRIETQYLDSRVVIQGSDVASAMKILVRKLGENGIVSITVGDQARRTLLVKCLNGHIRLAAGPVNLARRTGARLLPVFTVCTAQNRFEVSIGSPLPVQSIEDRSKIIHASLQQYAELLETYLLRHADQWNGWQSVKG